VLAEHRFAVLTGPPEMGKTATARMVALAKLTAGWEAHECTTPEDVWAAFDPTAAQVFIADDAFGSTEYRADAAEHWARAMERLLRTLDDRHWLIWTSRPAPLHAALRRLHRERGAERFPTPARVLIDAGDLDPADKTLILFRHAKAAQLPGSVRHRLQRHGREIVENRHFTPERIRRLVAAVGGGEQRVGDAIEAQLTTATEAMATSLATLGEEHRDLLVALLDTAPGPVAERDLVAALRRHHDGSLSHPPAELVDRLADHFLRVLA
jgi:conflict system STAND superfamily ATPase